MGRALSSGGKRGRVESWKCTKTGQGSYLEPHLNSHKRLIKNGHGFGAVPLGLRGAAQCQADLEKR